MNNHRYRLCLPETQTNICTLDKQLGLDHPITGVTSETREAKHYLYFKEYTLVERVVAFARGGPQRLRLVQIDYCTTDVEVELEHRDTRSGGTSDKITNEPTSVLLHLQKDTEGVIIPLTKNDCKEHAAILIMNKEHMKLLSSTLPGVCKNLVASLEKYRPKIGEFVCGSVVVGKWYRGIILTVNPTTMAAVDDCTVLFPSRVLPVPEQYREIPAMGVRIELHDSGLWPVEEAGLRFTVGRAYDESCVISVLSAKTSLRLNVTARKWTATPSQSSPSVSSRSSNATTELFIADSKEQLQEKNEKKQGKNRFVEIQGPHLKPNESQSDFDDWETNCQSFDPTIATQARPVIRKFLGGKPLDKKRFRENEQARWQQLQLTQQLGVRILEKIPKTCFMSSIIYCLSSIDMFVQKLKLDVQKKRNCSLFAESEFESQSFISDLFDGIFRSSVRCHFCYYASTTYETFRSLSVPLPPSVTVSLYDCLRQLLSIEVITRKCPKCNKKSSAEKQLHIVKLPKILTLQLNRYIGRKNFLQRKNCSVRYKINGWDLSSFVASDGAASDARRQLYSLCASTLHDGDVTRGHYTAVCKINELNRWYQWDKGRISEVTQADIESTKAAHLLFYVPSHSTM